MGSFGLATSISWLQAATSGSSRPLRTRAKRRGCRMFSRRKVAVPEPMVMWLGLCGSSSSSGAGWGRVSGVGSRWRGQLLWLGGTPCRALPHPPGLHVHPTASAAASTACRLPHSLPGPTDSAICHLPHCLPCPLPSQPTLPATWAAPTLAAQANLMGAVWRGSAAAG